MSTMQKGGGVETKASITFSSGRLSSHKYSIQDNRSTIKENIEEIIN